MRRVELIKNKARGLARVASLADGIEKKGRANRPCNLHFCQRTTSFQGSGIGERAVLRPHTTVRQGEQVRSFRPSTRNRRRVAKRSPLRKKKAQAEKRFGARLSARDALEKIPHLLFQGEQRERGWCALAQERFNERELGRLEGLGGVLTSLLLGLLGLVGAAY